MAKRRSDQRKRRTREHVIADLAVNHVERQVLLCGHTLQRVVHDYGLDAIVTTFSRRGEAENGLIWMQIKGTEHPDRMKDQNALAVRVERKHLLFWMGEVFPVILVVYDVTHDCAHWLHIQEAFGGGKIFEAARSGIRLALRVPVSQSLDAEAVGEFRRRKLRAKARYS